MNRPQKFGLSVAIAAIAIGAAFFTLDYARNRPYKKQIPQLPDSAILSAPLKEQISHAHNKASHNPSVDNLGMLGMVFHANAFYEEAMQCYQLASRKDPSEWVWSYYLGYLNKEMGNAKAAIDNFTRVIQENPKAYLAWYYLGKACQNTGAADKAVEYYNKIAFLPDQVTAVRTLRVNYSSVQALAKFELARICLNSDNTVEAEKLLLGIIGSNHSISPVYRLLGNVYAAKGIPELSRKYITRAQDLAEVTSIADTLADKLASMSRSELFLPRQIDDAVKSANPAWALELLKQALQYLSHDKYLISKAIKFYLRMDKGKEALPYLERHISDFSHDADELTEVADMLYRKGFYSQSLLYYGRAVALKPDNNEIRASYALGFWKDNQKDSALRIMKELFERNRKDPKVLANEVDFMIMTGDKSKALSYLNSFRQVAPRDAKVPKLEGMIAESEGNPSEAITLYEVAFARDPEDLETIRKLGTLLIDQKSWDKAVKLFRISLEHHPNDPHVLDRLGTLLISCPDAGLRNADEGLELSERAFYHISSPSSIMISSARNLAQAYAVKGNFKLAGYYINIAVNMAQDVHAPQELIAGLMNLAGKINYLGQKK